MSVRARAKSGRVADATKLPNNNGAMSRSRRSLSTYTASKETPSKFHLIGPLLWSVLCACSDPGTSPSASTATSMLDATAVEAVEDATWGQSIETASGDELPASATSTPTDAGPTDLASDATEPATETASAPFDAGDGALPPCWVGGPPPVAATTVGGPPPAPCSQVEPPQWFDGGPVPPPTLTVKLGRYDAKHNWLAYTDGDWAPLQQGGQGGGLFHLALAPKVLLPAPAGPTVKLQLLAFALQGCTSVATHQKPVFPFVEAPDAGPWYMPDPSKALVAVFVASGPQAKAKVCGQWLHVWVRLRIADGANAAGTNWGENHVVLRMYDDTALPSGPAP